MFFLELSCVGLLLNCLGVVSFGIVLCLSFTKLFWSCLFQVILCWFLTKQSYDGFFFMSYREQHKCS
jgi:hypothetical protein